MSAKNQKNNYGFGIDVREVGDDVTEEFNLAPKSIKSVLESEEIEDYVEHQDEFLRWALKKGKNPEKKEGYSETTMRPHISRLNKFYRYVWAYRRGYTTDVKHEDAENFLEFLDQERDVSRTHKSQSVKAINILIKWKNLENGENIESVKNRFTSSNYQPRDYLRYEERQEIREASMKYGLIDTSHLDDMSEDEVKRKLAQKYQIPKEEATIEKCKSWKIPSIVAVSLDTGLRPCEVERASINWIDFDNSLLVIPSEDSAKNDSQWEVPLKEKNFEVLEKWVEERETLDAYEDTDKLWLTQNGVPFNSKSLRDKMHKLFEVAGKRKENRRVSWYLLRHSLGTYMSHMGDSGEARSQLRHESNVSTDMYKHPPADMRRATLENMGQNKLRRLAEELLELDDL